jgi:hypothetical protein
MINSVGLRCGLLLYTAAIDRQNITQMVAQIDPAQSYVQLSALIPRTSAAWRIPKSMLFVDNIAECIGISTHLRNAQCSSMAEYRTMIVRPIHASLVVSLQEEY